MYIIQQRKSSICRTLILFTLLEFTFVEKSLSNQTICGGKNRGRTSYITLINRANVNWDEAWRQCNNQRAILPVICNQHEQDDFSKYLRENARYSSAWTSARKIAYDEWKWVDGQSFNSTKEVLNVGQHELNTRVYFDMARNHYTAADPRHKRHYLCYYSDKLGSSCMHENVIQVKNGCITPSSDEQSWFDARNQCLGNGGDLAIVDDDDLVTLRISSKLNAYRGYWIGLRNNTWRWMWHKAEPADDSGEEVKFTNWANNLPYASGECISVGWWFGGWNSVSCTETKRVVCQANETTILSETTHAMSSNSEISTCDCDAPKVLFITVVIVSLCVIIISDIIVALAVRKYIYRRLSASSNSAAIATSCYQDLETTQRQANPDGTYAELQLQPVYEEVSQRGK